MPVSASGPLSKLADRAPQTLRFCSRITRLVRLSSTTSTRTSWRAAREGAGLLSIGAADSRVRVNQNVLPFPASLSTPTWPPMRSTSFLQMASPSPVPPNRRVVDASAWMKLSKSRFCCAASIPMPVSVTSKRTPIALPCSDSLRTRRITSPESVNLTALPSMLMRIWRIRPGSPRRRIDICGSTITASSRSFSSAFGATSFAASSTTTRRSKSIDLDVELARLDLREIEDVVDDGQQRLRRLTAIVLRVLALLVRQGRS
jgi:hypothetical protein